MKKLKELEISLARKHRFPNRKKLVNREIETVVLMYINPINSKKCVTRFSWIFHFWFGDNNNINDDNKFKVSINDNINDNTI